MGDTLIGPAPTPSWEKRTGEDKVKPQQLADKLKPEERRWADNVLRALGLPNTMAQARVMASAVATASDIESRLKDKTDNESRKRIQDAKDRMKVVTDAGKPPWDTTTAQRVASADVELKILSMNKPAFEELKGRDNVNPAYWLKETADGGERRAYLCKPASTNSAVNPPGVPPGGEVPREALVGRLATLLQDSLKLTDPPILAMPETQVVSLPPSLGLPQHNRIDGQKPAVFSVQEARSSQGSLRDPDVAAKPQEGQVAALAVLDVIALNTDRHKGNLLVDANGNLIPIDHGCSLPDPEKPDAEELKKGLDDYPGLKRIEERMAGPQNALFSLPDAHVPFDKAFADKLKDLHTSGLDKQMRKARDDLAGAVPATEGLVSDAALDASHRAARVAKFAGATEGMTPAALLACVGGNATYLLNPEVSNDEFEARAKTLVANYAHAASPIRDMSLASDAEWGALCGALEARGWAMSPRYGAPVGGGASEPLMMLRLAATQESYPNEKGVASRQRSAKASKILEKLREEPLSKDEAEASLTTLQRQALTAITNLRDDVGAGQLVASLNVRIAQAEALGPTSLRSYLSAEIQTQVATVKGQLQMRLNKIKGDWNLPQSSPNQQSKVTAAEGELAHEDVSRAAKTIADLEQAATKGYLARKQPTQPQPQTQPDNSG